MKRDKAGKFTQAWDGESKHAVKLSLTSTAWQLLAQQAQALGISRSEMVERYARHFECGCVTEDGSDVSSSGNYGQAAAGPPEDALCLEPLLADPTAALQQLQQENDQLQRQVAELQQTIDQLRGAASAQQELPSALLPHDAASLDALLQPDSTREEQWLESVLNLLPTPLILVDPNEKRVIFSNRAANAIAGVDLAKDVGATYNADYHCTDANGQMIPPDQVPAIRAARGEKIQGLEISWHTPVGDFPLLVYADRLPAMHNHPQTSVVVFQDIRDRKRLETQLRESQRFSQQVADATPGVLYIYDLVEQRNVYVNRQVGEVLGYTAEQIQAMGNQLFPRLMHPDDLATLPEHLERFNQAQMGELIEREYRMRHADGTWYWLWSRDLIFSRTETGAPRQVIGISHDINDRKQAELAAARAADRTARLQSITAALSEALTPADVATVIVEQALSALGACRGLVALLTVDGQALELIRSIGYEPNVLTGWQSFPVKANVPLAHVVRTRTPIFMSSLDEMVATYPAMASLKDRIPAGAIAGIPLIAENTVLGSLAIGFTQAHTISEDDRAFMLTLARQCAQAVRRAQLYQAEQAARKIAEASEQRFRFLAESIPQMVWVAQPNGFTEYYNQRWFQYTGLTLEESQNANGSFRHPDDHERFGAAWIKAVTHREVFQAEQRIRRADGTYRWHLTRAYPLLDEQGEIVKWFGSCTDIDDWKLLYQQAERARQQAEQNAERTARLQAVTAALSEPLTPVQVAEVIAQQTLAVLGAAGVLVALLTPEQDMLEIVHFFGEEINVAPEWRRFPLSHATPLTDAVRTCQPMWEESVEERIARYPHLAKHYAQAKHPIWISLPLVVEGKSLGGITITFEKLPQLKPEDRALMLSLTQQCAQAIARAQLYEAEQRARAQAEAANRMKDEFLAVLSHELRTPMNPILGWSKLLSQGKLDSSKTALALETINRNARLQVQLIEDLLDVSRILQGKLSLNSCSINLAPVVDAAIETVHLAAEAKGIPIQFRRQAHECWVIGDATRLQQVVWNLLSNAVKFTPAGGRVELRLERTEVGAVGEMGSGGDGGMASSVPYACITVTDTGKGISPEFLPYVFDTFRQADSSSTRAFGGLGLGLAISRHIVELHGGTIQVDSPGEGKGATFAVRLPLTATPDPPESARLGDGALSLQGIQVLAVDDEIDNLELVTFILEQSGASVTAVSSAQEALQHLRQTRPNLLLADIGMPQMDGYGLLRQVRQLEAKQGNPPLPAIALTAYAGEADRQRALAAGFQHHLPKPVAAEALVAAIASLHRPPERPYSDLSTSKP
jgi:PAS domain S-box-containing protein